MINRIRCLRTFIRDTSNDLPPADTVRWSPRRKTRIVEAVRPGRLDLDTALQLYKVTLEEFLLWQRSIDKHGEKGNSVRNIKEDRNGLRSSD